MTRNQEKKIKLGIVPDDIENNIESLEDAITQIIIMFGGTWCANKCKMKKQEFTNFKNKNEKWSIEKQIKVYKLLWNALNY